MGDGQWGGEMGSGMEGWAVGGRGGQWGWRDGQWGGGMGSRVEGWGMGWRDGE